jgi:hypothetical protein
MIACSFVAATGYFDEFVPNFYLVIITPALALAAGLFVYALRMSEIHDKWNKYAHSFRCDNCGHEYLD